MNSSPSSVSCRGEHFCFTIVAAADANANIETSPVRHKILSAESGVVSAPFVIQ